MRRRLVSQRGCAGTNKNYVDVQFVQNAQTLRRKNPRKDLKDLKSTKTTVGEGQPQRSSMNLINNLHSTVGLIHPVDWNFDRGDRTSYSFIIVSVCFCLGLYTGMVTCVGYVYSLK
jgi:hypothetical protein